jgi:hypothetical protein
LALLAGLCIGTIAILGVEDTPQAVSPGHCSKLEMSVMVQGEELAVEIYDEAAIRVELVHARQLGWHGEERMSLPGLRVRRGAVDGEQIPVEIPFDGGILGSRPLEPP